MFLTSNMSSIHNQNKETLLIFNIVLSIYNNVSKNINFKGYTIMSILYSVGQLKKKGTKMLMSPRLEHQCLHGFNMFSSSEGRLEPVRLALN